MSEPTWTDVLTAFSTLGIGLLGVYFAMRQLGISRLQWKHELYDRRMAIYVAASTTISFLFRHGTITDEVLFEFLQKTRESDFLLNEQISKKLDEMYEKAVDLQTLQAESKDGEGQERTRKIREAGEIKKWYIAQGKELKKMFSPFLKLS